MEKILELIDKVLKENKIRYSYDNGLYTLNMGSLPALIQVESDYYLQYCITEEENYDNDLYYNHLWAKNDILYSIEEIEEMIVDIKEQYSSIMIYYNKIINLFEQVVILKDEYNVSENIISQLYDKIIFYFCIFVLFNDVKTKMFI